MKFAFECAEDVKNIQFDIPFLQDARLVSFLSGPRFRGRAPDGYVYVPVNRAMTTARIEPAAAEGRTVYRFDAIVIPHRVGRILLRSASVFATVPPPPADRADRATKTVALHSPTGEILGDNDQRGFVYAEPRSLFIHELPQNDVPADFTGLVGRYDLRAAVVPPSISFGEPLELVVSLSGQPYLSRATIPDARGNAALLAEFEVRQGAEFASVSEGARVFRYDLRPRRSGMLAIPALPFSYFDTDAGEYVSTSSAPVEVAVAENRVVTASDAEGAPVASFGQAEEVSDVAVRANSVAGAVKKSGESLPVESATVASLISGAVRIVRFPLAVGGVLVPPVIVLVVWLARKVVRRRVRQRAKPVELLPIEVLENAVAKQVEARESKVARAAAFESFRQYLGTRLRLPASSLTFSDIAPELHRRGVRAELSTESTSCFQHTMLRVLVEGGAVGPRLYRRRFANRLWRLSGS